MFIIRIAIGLLITISCTVSYAFDFTNYTPKLLALGDSITHGNGGNSYRCHLKDLAEQSSTVHFDYIGTRRGRECNDSGDFEHEGWGGRTAPDVIWNEKHPDTNQSRLEYSLAQDTPDIVLIHLGTNDIIQTNSNNLNSAITNATDALSDGISMIRDSNPDVIILLAKIMPLYYSNSAHNRVPPFNDAIQQLGDSLNTTRSPVVVVDQYTGITNSDLVDGVHQTPEGENKMAQRWFNALEPFFSKPADTTAPEINLYGDNPVWIARGSEYNDAGAIADDDEDGELTVNIDDSRVNTNRKGSYTVRFSAKDVAGNRANATRTVNVYIPDITAPVIKLNGKKTVFIEIGSDYTDAGATATDNKDGNRHVNIDASAVNTSEAGTYQVIFTTTDAAGNQAKTTRAVKVYIPDTTPPVIKLNGKSPLTIKVGTVYHDPGAIAVDEIDGRDPVTIDSSAVNIKKPGVYTVIITATDKAGNSARTARTVNVFEPDLKAPVITLKGEHTKSITVGTTYHDPGSTAVDNKDGTVAVIIDTSSLNTTKIGSYTIRFTAKDKAGNITTVKRIIKVIDKVNSDSGGGGNFSIYLLLFLSFIYSIRVSLQLKK